MTAIEVDYEYKTWAFLDELEKEKNRAAESDVGEDRHTCGRAEPREGTEDDADRAVLKKKDSLRDADD